METTNHLLHAVESSDVTRALELFKAELRKGVDAWDIHLSLFPFVQRVMNPPFINPHLPKMYCIYRELISHLTKDEIAGLVELEINEYTRRPKLEKLLKAKVMTSTVSFNQIESAIREQDREKTATLMATFSAKQGGTELARRLLLLGSGFLDVSLGHSISCTAFILLETLGRPDQDPWPALATLADYFCKGRFDTTPGLEGLKFYPDEILDHHMLRATSGRGILNLHHTITRYAIERVRKFFHQEEYNHMINVWIDFLGDKEAERVRVDTSGMGPAVDYEGFSALFPGWMQNLLLPPWRE